MRASRLSIAVEAGLVALPQQGDILVLNPTPRDDLSVLPRARVLAVQPFRPDHDALLAQGFRVVPSCPDQPFAAAVVCLPRAREAALALVAKAAAAVTPGGPVVVDGQKTDGVEAVLRELRAHVALSEPLIKAHGRLAWFAAGPDLSPWTALPRMVEGGFRTMPGVFSADGPDDGSALLARALPARMPGRGVDLGAGWGFLAQAVLSREDVTALDLVEADAVALDCARANVTDPRATFHWADATTFRPARPAGFVVCNPPFHVGRSADPTLGEAFLQAAHRMLAPEGALWLVANRPLPYDRTLNRLFREVEEIGGTPAFRLTCAAKPLSISRR